MGLLGIESGYVQEMDWLTQILNWPTQWTSLHGVATITTPVFRLIVDSTAIAEKQIVQRDGPMYPDEGARGVEFPFKELHALHVYRKDEYTDNGFSSRDAMDKAHEPILQLVTEALSQESGAVREGKIIDLGCGNGALLEKIVLTAPWLKPCGVEKEKIKCDRAARRLTAYAPEFHHGSIYDEMLWAPPYLVALMSVERLLEAPKSDLIHLLMRLRDGCNKVILYSYSKERDFTSELASDFFKLIVGYQNELSIAHLLKPKRKHD